MKNKKQLLISLLLLQVFLVTSANAFAFSHNSAELLSSHEKFSEVSNNQKAILFEQSSSELNVQSFSEEENDNHTFRLGTFFSLPLYLCFTENSEFSEFLPNGKEWLKKQIFPFHFFW